MISLRMIRRSGLLLALAAGTMAAPVHAGPAEEARIRASLQQAVPQAKVQAVRETPMPGVYEVELPTGMVYASADGRFVIQGELLQLDGKQVTNLTEKASASKRVAVMKTIKRQDEIVFPARGKAKAVLTVFTDIDCGYCRKLHQEVPELNRLGVEVRYLAYPRDLPRAGATGGTGGRMGQIWCNANREQALTLAKQGKSFPAARKNCTAPIAEQFALGQRMGVTGTPAVFNEQGEQLGGYMPAAKLAQALGLN
ncbi:DsbC family protein [Amnimonas aquatica]|uniref:DsbC family protein n=1 Tax=Amnimonas aquatica TaxID=2094561 RepID=UPI001F150AEB|nr:DsbC family protein [Amnimonas aquatica]